MRKLDITATDDSHAQVGEIVMFAANLFGRLPDIVGEVQFIASYPSGGADVVTVNRAGQIVEATPHVEGS